MTGIIIIVVAVLLIGAMAALYFGIDHSQKARRDVARSDEEGFLRSEGTVGEVLSEETGTQSPDGTTAD